ILPLLEPAALAHRSEKISIQTSSSLATLFLGMDLSREKSPYCNTAANPFRDLRVRQPIAHAINIDHILNDVMLNFASPPTQLVAAKVFGYNETLQRLPYDPVKAKALLKESGYPDGFSVRFDITNGRYRNDVEIGKAIAQDLKAIGID